MTLGNFAAWLAASHRRAHLLGGLLLGLLLSFPAALGAALGMELKDCQRDGLNRAKTPDRWTWRCWDWADFALTAAGGLAGGAANGIILYWILT